AGGSGRPGAGWTTPFRGPDQGMNLHVPAATGHAEWLCPTVVEYLTRTAAHHRDQAGALGTASL
ncbi:MAG: hypothetical protein ACLGI3_13955, partial [Actinomycetes bacterium]